MQFSLAKLMCYKAPQWLSQDGGIPGDCYFIILRFNSSQRTYIVCLICNAYKAILFEEK